ncbi:hypothetical protein A134_06790 [Vibrio crassostreae 9CS106]|nr:hypothetical protein A134_06790 [Vibrio crassostreae 9CS106]
MEQLLLNYEPRYYRNLTEFVEKSEWQGAFLLNLTFRGIGECSAIYFRYKKAPHIGEANIIYCLLSVSL